MKASGVIFTPAAAALSFSFARSASSSVMSASSYCVTCGMLTHAACRRRPEIFWMRPSGLTSTSPNFAKSTLRHLRQRRTSALQGHRTALLDPGLHVIVRDAAAQATALHAPQVHAQFARQLAHRGAGMRGAESGFADRRQARLAHAAAAAQCSRRWRCCAEQRRGGGCCRCWRRSRQPPRRHSASPRDCRRKSCRPSSRARLRRCPQRSKAHPSWPSRSRA